MSSLSLSRCWSYTKIVFPLSMLLIGSLTLLFPSIIFSPSTFPTSDSPDSPSSSLSTLHSLSSSHLSSLQSFQSDIQADIQSTESTLLSISPSYFSSPSPALSPRIKSLENQLSHMKSLNTKLSSLIELSSTRHRSLTPILSHETYDEISNLYKDIQSRHLQSSKRVSYFQIYFDTIMNVISSTSSSDRDGISFILQVIFRVAYNFIIGVVMGMIEFCIRIPWWIGEYGTVYSEYQDGVVAMNYYNKDNNNNNNNNNIVYLIDNEVKEWERREQMGEGWEGVMKIMGTLEKNGIQIDSESESQKNQNNNKKNRVEQEEHDEDNKNSKNKEKKVTLPTPKISSLLSSLSDEESHLLSQLHSYSTTLSPPPPFLSPSWFIRKTKLLFTYYVLTSAALVATLMFIGGIVVVAGTACGLIGGMLWWWGRRKMEEERLRRGEGQAGGNERREEQHAHEE